MAKMTNVAHTIQEKQLLKNARATQDAHATAGKDASENSDESADSSARAGAQSNSHFQQQSQQQSQHTPSKHAPSPAERFEAIFDISYLVFDLIAAMIFFICANGRTLFNLYGILTLVLCIGDAFHLIPRVSKALHGINPQVKRQLGRGLQISSITMTVFYILLMYIWQATFSSLRIPTVILCLVWLSACARIVICMLPQNGWTSNTPHLGISLARNSIFALTGLGVICLYAISGNAGGLHMTRMIWAIAISFVCYLPVTILSKKYPAIGMLMIPKTCAYVWMIAMGLELLMRG